VLTNTIKNIVSKNKKRFVWEDYDLDLAYITDNIIAMGFPSQNIEAMYRNSLEEV
jgi:phosphatidylinositol-3,4,5-trisphosphate 3-phosphatase/dual-specificity protein phosphatase PTEN